jgi:hypothetical protein
MPTSRSTSLVSRLSRYERVLHNAQSDPEIAELLAEFSFDALKIAHGRGLYEHACMLQRAQEREYGEQYDATAAMTLARKQAEESYRRFADVARVALRGERGAPDALGLNERGKKSLTEWIEGARRFYAHALTSRVVQEKLAQFNISREQLEGGRQGLEALDHARRAQERAQSEAKDATKKRDAAVEALDRWMDDFFAIARVAVRQRPQLREKLGLRVYTK